MGEILVALGTTLFGIGIGMLITFRMAARAFAPVRCKDCKHYSGGVCDNHSVPAGIYNDGFMFPNDFCSYGERKDGDPDGR